MHYDTDVITHGRPLLNQLVALVEQVSNMPTEFQLSETNGSRQAQTWTVCLTDRDAISPSPIVCEITLCTLIHHYNEN